MLSNQLPGLRFPEFSEEYNTQKIENILTRIKNPVDLEVDVAYTEIGIRSWGKGIFHKENTNKEQIGNKRVFWLESDLFIVNIVFAWEQAVAKTTEQEVGKIASHRFPMYKPKSELADLDYLVWFFLTNRGKYLLEMASPGGAGRNKTLGQKEFNRLLLCLPRVEEQNKVAKALNSIDKKISLLKEKHVLLSQYKKGVMQKLFKQEIRFKDENGNTFPDWQLEPIGKYLEEYKERVSADTEIPVLTSSRTGLYPQQRAVVNEGEYGVVPKGYFTYRHMSDDLVFKFNINRIWDRGAVSKEYPVFKAVGMNSYFLELCLNEGDSFKRFAIQQKVGGTRTRLYFKNLVKLKLNTPSLEEQNKIAEFLQCIDKKINSVKEQVELTQTFKKCLLQQMFV